MAPLLIRSEESPTVDAVSSTWSSLWWPYVLATIVISLFVLTILVCVCGGDDGDEKKAQANGAKTGAKTTEAMAASSTKKQGKGDTSESSIIVAIEEKKTGGAPATSVEPKVALEDLDLGHSSHHSLKPKEGLDISSAASSKKKPSVVLSKKG